MAKFAYLFLDLGALIGAGALAYFGGVAGRRNIRPLLRACLLVSVPFIIWDMLAAYGGHWSFNGHYVLPPRIVGIPIEEMLFFVCIPLFGWALFMVLSKKVPDKPVPRWVGAVVMGLLSIAALLLIGFYHGQGYTQTVALALLVTVAVLLWQRRLLQSRNFWLFQAAILGVFLIGNTYLTAMPIITYGPHAIIGLRIGTIPVEDFVYNFALINLFILAALGSWKGVVVRHGSQASVHNVPHLKK